MTNLVRYEAVSYTLEETLDLGKVLAQSGYFSDARDAAKAVAKILAGRELGIGPLASLTGIYIVQNRVTLSANLMAACIKRSGIYTYRVSWSDNSCSIEYFEHGESIGVSEFGSADQQRAGLSSEPWKKYPRNMWFARAMSNGAKWYCADVFAGPMYTPEELGADVTEDGQVIELPAQSEPEPQRIANPPTNRVLSLDPAAYRLKLWHGLNDLVSEARILGVPTADVEQMQFSGDAPNEVIIEMGRTLRAAINAKKQNVADSQLVEASA